jgi:protein SCO1/2
MRLVLLALCLWACGSPEPEPARAVEPAAPAVVEPSAPLGEPGALPSDSVYQLEPALVDQDGHPFALSSLRGRPVLVTFFYASCTTMCPLVITEVRALDALLEESERARVSVLLVSIDERDTPEHLRALADERHLPLERYRLVRGEPSEVRTLAATLGMTYRNTSDGGFAHAALFTLLDAEGRVSFQHDGLGTGTERLRDRLRALLPPGKWCRPHRK